MPFEDMVGKTIVKIELKHGELGARKPYEVLFIFDDETYMRMYHQQNCCESVWLEDVTGDWADMEGMVLDAYEDITCPAQERNSATHTFYRIQTNKGVLTMRWIGESNGYYSEEVDIQWGQA
jgi:hypothetical protein